MNRRIESLPSLVARAPRPWDERPGSASRDRSEKPSIDAGFFQEPGLRSLCRPSTGEGARATLLSVLALLSLLMASSTASAHAMLDRAEPRVGSEVAKSPEQVRIWFTQQPEHAFSTIKVLNSDGKQVDKNDTRTDPDDSKALVVSVPSLPPGTYKVVWKVLSTDTHRTEGSFKFTIKP